jgi:hypothetical protein
MIRVGGHDYVFCLFAAVGFCGVLVFGLAAFADAAEMDEVQQKNAAVRNTLDLYETKEAKPQGDASGIRSRAGFFSGFETNARLDAARKGDVFRGVAFAAAYGRSLSSTSQLLFRYDLFSYNYDETTDNSYLLNNLNGRWVRKVFFGQAGIGVDLGIVAYPHNAEGDFFIPRGFVFLRHNTSRRFTQQWEAEALLRNYMKAKAISEALAIYQDKDRSDKQWGVGYQFGSMLGEKAFFYLKAKFSVNDSNSLYQDYYDYDSYRGGLGLTYKLAKKDYLVSSVFFTRKSYLSRLTLDGEKRQKGDLTSVSAGWRHVLSQACVLSLSYQHLQNVSNEPSARYSGSVMTMSLSYNF